MPPPKRRKLVRGKKKRRARYSLDELGGAPPPPDDDGSWSNRKTVLVISVVFGLPVVLLLASGRVDILEALGLFLLIPTVLFFYSVGNIPDFDD